MGVWLQGSDFLWSAIKEVTSPPEGPFLGLTADTPAHSPWDHDRSSLIHEAPRPHTVAPHSPPHSSWAGCVCSSDLTDLGPDSPPVSHLSPSWISPCLSKLVRVSTGTPGLMPTWTSRDVLRHRRDKTWKIWVSMSQAGTPSNPCILFLLPSSYLSLF